MPRTLPTGQALTCCAALLAAGPWAAGQPMSCYEGGSEAGELRFAGAVEGTDFNGWFREFSVRYCFEETDPTQGTIEVHVVLESADTRNRDRDQALKGEEFFDVERYPEAHWRSIMISPDSAGYVAEGVLELKRFAHPQVVRYTLTPESAGQIAVEGWLRMDGEAQVDRQRFEVGTGEFADPQFVRNRIDVDFRLQLTAAD